MVAGGQRLSPFVPLPTTTARPAPEADPVPANGAPKEASTAQPQRLALAR